MLRGEHVGQAPCNLGNSVETFSCGACRGLLKSLVPLKARTLLSSRTEGLSTRINLSAARRPFSQCR